MDGPASLPLWGGSWTAWLRSGARAVLDSVRIAREIRARDIDALVVNSTVSLSSVIAGAVTGRPVLLHARDPVRSRLTPLVNRVEKSLAMTIVAISRHTEQSLGPPGRGRIVCIPAGIDVDGVAAWPPRLEQPLRLCVVGTVEERKGQDIALEALGILRERGVEAKLRFLGRANETGFLRELRQRAEQLNLSDHVEIGGPVTDVLRQVEQMDIVLGPSRAEPLGLALLEAMLLAKPVIAARVGGIPEFVQHRSTGLLVDCDAPDQIATAVQDLVATPAETCAMGERGRQFVLQQYTLKRSLEGYTRELELLLQQRCKRRRRNRTRSAA